MERTLVPESLGALLAGPAGGDVILLDVRRRPAFEADPCTIPGAAWRDPHAVDAWAAELSPGVPVVVYCVHGHEVSNGVADHLRSLGFDAALLEGGFEGWKAAAGPVVEAPTPAQAARRVES